MRPFLFFAVSRSWTPAYVQGSALPRGNCREEFSEIGLSGFAGRQVPIVVAPSASVEQERSVSNDAGRSQPVAPGAVRAGGRQAASNGRPTVLPKSTVARGT